MQKVFEIGKIVAQDTVGYFTKNGGMNSTTGVTLVGAPALLSVVDQMTAGTDMAQAVAAGGWPAIVAGAWYGLRLVIYVVNKANK